MTDKGDFNRRDFDSLAPTWDENPQRVELARAVAQAIGETVPLNSKMKALDYGAGTGLVALALSKQVESVTAADASAGMLEVLRAKLSKGGVGNVHPISLDLERGEPPQEAFDLVVCSMTLHHIPDAGRMLKVFAGMLRPGGWVCIADLDPDAGQFHSDNTGVAHFGFERSALESMMVAAGLCDVKTRTALKFTREGSSGDMRAFSVFLASGRKA